MANKINWKWVRFVLNVAVFSGVAAYVYLNRSKFFALTVYPLYLWSALACAIMVLFSRSLVLEKLVRSFGGRDGLVASLEGVSVATVCNIILPTNLGTLYLVGIIRNRLGGGLAQPFTLQGISALMIVLVDSVVATTGMLLASIGVVWILGVYCLWILGFVGAFALASTLGKRYVDKPGLVARILSTLYLARKQKVIGPIFGLCAMETLAMTGVIACIFLSMGVSLSLGETLFFTGVRNTSILFALTPGALGVSEAILSFVGGYIGIASVQAVFVGLLVRVVIALGSLICLGLALLVGRLPKLLAVKEVV